MTDVTPDAKRLRLTLPPPKSDALQVIVREEPAVNNDIMEYFAERGSRVLTLQRESSEYQDEIASLGELLKKSREEIHDLKASTISVRMSATISIAENSSHHILVWLKVMPEKCGARISGENHLLLPDPSGGILLQDKVRSQDQEAEACRKLYREEQNQTEEQYKKELARALSISAKLKEVENGQVIGRDVYSAQEQAKRLLIKFSIPEG